MSSSLAPCIKLRVQQLIATVLGIRVIGSQMPRSASVHPLRLAQLGMAQ